MAIKLSPLPMLTDSDQLRFWSKVGITDNDQECWLWMSAKSPKGYGEFSIRNRSYRAHRLVWKLTTGSDPLQLMLHSCDNPSCCNPRHLRVGTPVENTGDMMRRGRGRNTKTQCINGHDLALPNAFRWTRRKNTNPVRRCLACETEAYRRRRALQRGNKAS